MSDQNEEVSGLPAVVSERRKEEQPNPARRRAILEQCSRWDNSGGLALDPEGGEANTLIEQVDSGEVVYYPTEESEVVEDFLEAWVEEMYQHLVAGDARQREGEDD